MGIRQVIGNLVQTPPTIEFFCDCYHYETYTTVSHDGNHHPRHDTHTRAITTYTERVFFPYYSARDVSGLFELNKSREAAMGKVYVKLELIPEINFDDTLSYMDYE